MKKNNFNLIDKTICKTNFISAFVLTLFIFALTSSLIAQSPRPTPTPDRDTPAVISRDNEANTSSTNRDVIETVNDSDEIKIPKQNSTSAENVDVDTTKNQKKMMLYLDLLTRTEQRAASLEKQLFELLEKQNTYTAKIKQLEYQLRPEVISSTTGLTGSLRPEDLREQRRLALELEKSNVESLLQRLDSRRSSLEESVRKAEALVEKIRTRFDRIIDATLAEDDENF